MRNFQKAIAFSLVGLLLPLTANAEEGLLSQVSKILKENISPTDESMAMLKAVLGDFVLNPFSHAASNDGVIMGEMFKTFNMFIFIVAMLWFTYTALAGLAQTMHEGVILGRKMSTVWVPIRISFGAASLMPVFGGWAFCQALMVIAATLGIAGANSIANTAIDSGAGFKVTVNPMGSVKQANQLHDVELHMLLSTACTRAANALNKEAVEIRGVSAVTTYKPSLSSTDTTVTMQFQNDQGVSGCGKIELQFSPRKNNSASSILDYSAGSTFGFRIEGVNYEGIRNVSIASHKKTLQAVYESANKILDGALSTDADSAAITTAITELNNGYFGSYAKLFQDQLQQMTTSANGTSNVSAVSDQLLKNMKEGGWATLGVWYSVFAEVNEAMNEMLDPVVRFEEPKISSTSVDDSVISALSGLISAAQSRPNTRGMTTATGDASVGQYILGKALGGLAGSSSTGASQTINPIIAFKNIGDNALALAQTILAAVKGLTLVAEASPTGIVAKAVSVMGSAGKSGGIIGTVMGLVAEGGAVLSTVAWVMFAAAAAMAFYLPMLPFIQWFAALVQWFTSILESLIGSSLWALAHFDSDGEGMGQRTSYGYLYLFNNFARPIILTFAFFFASATVTVLGTFLFKYFSSAVASAQGNSLTGLMSIVAYLVMFAIIGMTLINSAFSMLLSMADRIIGWIGQQAGSHIGSDVENRINGVFIQAARSGGQVISAKTESLSNGRTLLGSITNK